jgi:hypothetical protein
MRIKIIISYSILFNYYIIMYDFKINLQYIILYLLNILIFISKTYSSNIYKIV